MEESCHLKKKFFHQSFERFLAVVLGKEGPGILALLGHKQETPFNRLFVASQSSADVCSLLVPHADDRFGTSNKGGFSVGFTLVRAVTISGVKVFSDESCFPKSFGISVELKTNDNDNSLQNNENILFCETKATINTKFID